VYVFIPLRKNGDVFGNDFVGANKYSPDSFVFRDRGTDHRRETGYRGVAKGAYSAIVVQGSQKKIARHHAVSGFVFRDRAIPYRSFRAIPARNRHPIPASTIPYRNHHSIRIFSTNHLYAPTKTGDVSVMSCRGE